MATAKRRFKVRDRFGAPNERLLIPFEEQRPVFRIVEVLVFLIKVARFVDKFWFVVEKAFMVGYFCFPEFNALFF